MLVCGGLFGLIMPQTMAASTLFALLAAACAGAQLQCPTGESSHCVILGATLDCRLRRTTERMPLQACQGDQSICFAWPEVIRLRRNLILILSSWDTQESTFCKNMQASMALTP